MRTGTLRGLINQAVTECGGNPRAGYQLAARKLYQLMEQKKVSPSDFSFRQLFEELVDPQRTLDIRSDPQQIAEAISSSAFPEITNRIIHGTILPEYEQYSLAVDRLVTEEQATKTQSEEVAGLTEMAGPELRPELLAYEEAQFGEKWFRIFMADFGRIVSLSREAIFDDRTGEIVRRARGIGKKGGLHRARMVIQSIEMLPRTAFKEAASRAFVFRGTAWTAANFYNVTHAVVDVPRVNSNTLADPLSTAGMINGMLLFGSMVDYVGDEIVVSPEILLVPDALRVVAWQLTTAQTQYDTANRAGNIFGPQGDPSMKLLPMSTPLLSSTTRWYLGAFKQQLLWLWVWKPETAAQGNDTTKAFENQIVQRYRFNYNGGVGHTDYVNIVRGGP